jgi:predicted dehydrogenase
MRRRTFILTTGATALATQTAAGANDRINVGVVGVRSRGREHIDLFTSQPNTAVAAVCDVDTGQTERAVPLAARAQGFNPKVFQDIRRLLEDKDIDAVTLATCNHWHALGAVWACQAGKDVFVEKPASHNIWEGRQMVETARKYQRVVQAGMQSRSIAHKRRAI